MARFVKLKDVKLYDYFVIPTKEEKQGCIPGDDFYFEPSESRVRVRGHYVRSSKKYSYFHYNDVCREAFKNGNTLVIVDFFF